MFWINLLAEEISKQSRIDCHVVTLMKVYNEKEKAEQGNYKK